MNTIQDSRSLIKRSSKTFIEKTLSKNPNWKILDIGCGYNANKFANVICDEHVEDLEFFIKELERISSKGYIELPTKLEDNLVFENKNDHIWQMDFDDIENKLIINKRIQYFEPILTVSSIKQFNKFFRKSLVLELEWNDVIDYNFIKIDEKSYEKMSIVSLVRKYFSKKIRTFIKKK